MNKKQLMVTWLMAAVTCMAIFKAVQLNKFYREGYRVKDKKGNIYHFLRVGHKDTWNDILKWPSITVIVTLGIGSTLIFILRDRKG